MTCCGRSAAAKKPVLLKRGVGATLQELLLSAEYLLAAGNPRVMLCRRGIRTFDTFTRGTLDLAAVPALHEMTHLPSSSTRAMRPGARPCCAAGAGCRGLRGRRRDGGDAPRPAARPVRQGAGSAAGGAGSAVTAAARRAGGLQMKIDIPVSQPYSVDIAPGLLDDLGRYVSSGTAALVVTSRACGSAAAGARLPRTACSGVRAVPAVLPAGEDKVAGAVCRPAP